MKLKQEDLFYLTAKELNISQEKIEYVIKYLFRIIRFEYLADPLKLKKGIYLNGLCKLVLPPEKIANKILKNWDVYDDETRNLYLKLLKQTENGKRKDSYETIHERLNSRVKDKGTSSSNE